jgi:hypothetical protein
MARFVPIDGHHEDTCDNEIGLGVDCLLTMYTCLHNLEV